MSRPDLPSRSRSRKTMDPPHDASKPDAAAVTDVYREVAEMGSLELAGEKLRQVALERQREEEEEEAEQERLKEEYRKKQELARRVWEEDPEEAEYVAQQQQRFADGEDMEYEEDGGDGRVQGAHMQQVIEGLWIGDLVAAMDQEALAEQGIVCLSMVEGTMLTQTDQHTVFAEAQARVLGKLCRLPARDRRRTRYGHPLAPALVCRLDPVGPGPPELAGRQRALNARRGREEGERPPGAGTQGGQRPRALPGGHEPVGDGGRGVPHAAVRVRACRRARDDPQGQVASRVSQCLGTAACADYDSPSDTFWYQLALFYNADGRVSLKDRQTRQFYMERTTSSFMSEQSHPNHQKAA